MKITIEQEGKEPIVFDDVVEYSMCGLHGKIQFADFYSYNGTERLVGLTYTQLKRLEKVNDIR